MNQSQDGGAWVRKKAPIWAWISGLPGDLVQMVEHRLLVENKAESRRREAEVRDDRAIEFKRKRLRATWMTVMIANRTTITGGRLKIGSRSRIAGALPFSTEEKKGESWSWLSPFSQ